MSFVKDFSKIKPRRVLAEEAERLALFERAALDPRTRDDLFGIFNEGKRSFSEGRKFKRSGLKKGVPDICLPVPSPKGHHALYIELKRVSPRGILSPEQKEWLRRLNAHGNYAVACWGWQEAWKVICDYLEGKL